MLRPWLASLLMLVLPGPVMSLPIAEIGERVEIMFLATRYLHDRKFDRLAELEHEYTIAQSRTTSGVWKLTVFHKALADHIAMQYECATCIPYFEGLLKDWRKARPDAVTPDLLVPEILMLRAWAARGDGYANDIPQERLDRFQSLARQAAVYMANNRRRLFKSPHAYSVALDIGQAAGLDRDAYNALMAEARSVAPGYYDTYFTASYYNLPQWHGSRKQLDKLARQAMATTAKTDKTGLYARVYWIVLDFYRNKLFTDTDADWATMKQSMRDIAAQYPSDWNYSHFAQISCVAKQEAEVRHYLALIKNPTALPWTDAGGRATCGRFD